MLYRSAAPVEAPITLAEAKMHLRVDGSDEDDYITALIAAAVSLLDGQGDLGRAMVTQTWQQWVGPSPASVRLLMGPFIALTAVDYYDTDSVLQSATLTDFEARLDGDFVRIHAKTGFSWPSTTSRNDAIRLTFTAGYGAASAVPDGLKHAIKLIVGHWYANREAASEVTLKDIPIAVDAIVGNERVRWYG